MEFVSRIFRGVFQRLLPPGKAQTSRTDAYLNAVYKVLVWDDPKISFMTLGVLHVLLWLIVQLELRFYGVIFLVSLLLFLCDLYFERKELKAERNSSSDAMRQVGRILSNISLHLQGLRKDSPSMFCVIMCGIFLSLTVVARNVSGFALSYLILLAIFTGPLIISRLPSEYLLNVKDIVQNIGSNEGLLAESELLPFIANKDFNEKDPELESLLTDKTADSVTNSLISGLMSMPSHLDAEGSLDGLEEEDLEFNMRAKPSAAISYTPGEISSDSDSDHKGMSFESSHFNRDSSSEDENLYSKGLRFSEAPKSDPEPGTSQLTILSNLTAIGSSLITTVLKSGGTPKRKDSDSDFEIIYEDEINQS
ncbi:hypothetical protein PPYR_11424 [Photinus pyralis]|uniref:RETREG1-3/ARL6IP-like N-terminal reticulon-homology domain-containing protein n=1 Tax=Photinus pyralis TaxID=7054 RepID=A0A1Y1K9R9_PHOPY|nr:reticulophagy regulator 3-like [Photinus pyralis]XP_031350038.1 reticulophagy regulator 3-like [Photinus pyralis]KAB0794585.1 hypothetical protein PPYR_11424 [Photinus pyralis]